MHFLLSTLPAPLDWLSWGLLTGPAGLVLIGVGLWGLRGFSRLEPEAESSAAAERWRDACRG